MCVMCVHLLSTISTVSEHLSTWVIDHHVMRHSVLSLPLECTGISLECLLAVCLLVAQVLLRLIPNGLHQTLSFDWT